MIIKSAAPQKTNLRSCFEGHDFVPTQIEVYKKIIKLENGKGSSVNAERRKCARCKVCKSKTSYYCIKCGTNALYCQPISKNGALCTCEHKRFVEAEECKKIPGCSGWISYESNKW